MSNVDDLDFFGNEDKDIIKNFSLDFHKLYLDKIKMSEEEYSKICEPYISECDYFSDIIKTQKSKRNEFHEGFARNTAREEKSIGGETIHRGYYCPSLIQDIVIGNCSRGKLCKSDNPKAVYTHYFDANNKHIATKTQDGDIESIEYISYCDNKSLSAQFNGEFINYVSECKYDDRGRILSYTFVAADAYGERAQEYEKETYTYEGDKMVVEHISFIVDKPPVLTLNKYIFAIESGYIKSYIIDVFDTVDISGEPLKDRTHKVKIKRKI